MAKHKKKRPHKVSKGLRNSISPTLVRMVRESRSEIDKIMHKHKAWRDGKKGNVTIANPNADEKDKPFIKVSFNRYFGNGSDYKTVKYGVKRSDDKNKVEF